MSDERIAQYYSSGLYRQTLGISIEDMDADEKRRALDVAVWLDRRGVIPSSHADIGASRGYLLGEVGASEQGQYDLNPRYSKVDADNVDNGKFELITSIHVLEIQYTQQRNCFGINPCLQNTCLSKSLA